MDGFSLQHNQKTYTCSLEAMPNEQEEYSYPINSYLSKPVKLSVKKEKSTIDYSSATSAQTNQDLSNYYEITSKERGKESDYNMRKESDEDKMIEDTEDWELIQAISSVPDYFEKLAKENNDLLINTSLSTLPVKSNAYNNHNTNFNLSLNVNAIPYQPNNDYGYSNSINKKNNNINNYNCEFQYSYGPSNQLNNNKNMIEQQNILMSQNNQESNIISNQNNSISEPVEENFLEFIIKLLEENNNDRDKQTQIILNFNQNQMYTFIMNSYGREFIIGRLTSLTDIKDEPMSQERLSQCLIFVQKLINNMKSYLFSYIASPYGCEILLRIVNYLNYYERLNLWKIISEANLLFLASEEPSASIIIQLVKSITEKCEEIFITKLLNVRYLPVPITNSISVVSPINLFDQNLLFLVNKSSTSIKLVQTILERFSSTSVLPYQNFFHNNLQTILLSPIGNELVRNHIAILSSQDKLIKEHFLGYLLCTLEVSTFNEIGLNTLVYLIEIWGIEFIEAILKNCFLNPTIYFYKDVVSDLGVCGLLGRLLTHTDKSIKLQAARDFLFSIPNYEDSLLNAQSSFYFMIQLAIFLVRPHVVSELIKFIKKHSLLSKEKLQYFKETIYLPKKKSEER